jgi:hypothetical protein
MARGHSTGGFDLSSVDTHVHVGQPFSSFFNSVVQLLGQVAGGHKH